MAGALFGPATSAAAPAVGAPPLGPRGRTVDCGGERRVSDSTFPRSSTSSIPCSPAGLRASRSTRPPTGAESTDASEVPGGAGGKAPTRPAASSPRSPVPGDLGELVAGRVRRLPARSRQELLLASVLSAPVGGLVDLDALSPAREQGMLEVDDRGKVEFAHPLFAAAVYGAASGAERRAAHRRAAALVAGPEERARHLALAADGPDLAIAAALDQAAEAAVRRSAPDAAAELAELAARLDARS